MTITPEKMEILSLPGPDRSITDDDLEKRVLVSSRYRNRRIGDFLKELKMVEGRNTGIPLILNAMKNNGSDLPSFKTDEERSYFRVILPIHSLFLGDGKKAANVRATRKSQDEIKGLVIAALEQYGDLSMNELSAKLGYKKLTDGVRAAVNDLLDEGKVTYLYPDKPKSRKQKICLVL